MGKDYYNLGGDPGVNIITPGEYLDAFIKVLHMNQGVNIIAPWEGDPGLNIITPGE